MFSLLHSKGYESFEKHFYAVIIKVATIKKNYFPGITNKHFSLSAKMNGTQSSKSMKNALHILWYTKRYLSG